MFCFKERGSVLTKRNPLQRLVNQINFDIQSLLIVAFFQDDFVVIFDNENFDFFTPTFLRNANITSNGITSNRLSSRTSNHLFLKQIVQVCLILKCFTHPPSSRCWLGWIGQVSNAFVELTWTPIL